MAEPGTTVVTDKTLRDEFAMAALQGGLTNPLWFSGGMDSDEISKVCYKMADAMLKVRDGGT